MSDNSAQTVATSSVSPRNCNAFTNSYDQFFLEDVNLKEWQTLLDQARNITAASSLPMVLWKVCRFFFSETSPVVLLWFLINILINGEGSWIHYCTPVLINVILSAVIAYYCCNEKREVVRAMQGQQYSSLFCDTIKKMLALMFDWIMDSRGYKRTQKIRIIEDNMYRCSHSGRWVKRQAFIELTKFYSSQLRYLREDILVTTLRSFTLAMFAMYTMTVSKYAELRICEVGQFFKLGYVIWIVLKTSYILKLFQESTHAYVATMQLWGTIWSEKDSILKIELCEYHKVHEFESKGGMMILDMLPNILLMALRFISATLCLIIFGLPGILFWYFLIVGANIFVLDFLCRFGEWNVLLRNKYDNPPTGYARLRHVWIDRIMSPIFYNYGYSSQGLNGTLGFKTFFSIPPYIILLLVYWFYTTRLSSPLQNTSDTDSLINASRYVSVSKSAFHHHRQCSLTPYLSNQSETDSYGILNCIQKELSSNPINVVDYLGGINAIVLIVTLKGICCFMMELLQKYLRKRQNIRLEKFATFPYFDAANCYRSLICGVLQKPIMYLKNTGTNSIDDIDLHDQVNTTVLMRGENHIQQKPILESFIQHMMAITLFNSTAFGNVWSLGLGIFNKFSPGENFFKQRDVAIDYCLSAIQKLDDLFTRHELNHMSSLIGFREILSLKDLFSEELTGIRYTYHHLNYINDGYCGITFGDWNSFSIGNEITVGELAAIRMMKRFQKNRHPLEPSERNNYNVNLLTRIFIRLQEETRFDFPADEDKASFLENFKRQYVLIFVIFCAVLDSRLSQMSSSRIEKTFEMLHVEISKTYYDYEYEE